MSEANAQVEVETDHATNKGMLIYFAVMGTAGVVVLVLTLMKEWGFWGWMGAIMLLLVGIGGAAGLMKSGGAGKILCPSCGHSNDVLHINEARIMQCEGCQAWLEGSTSMALCTEDRVADSPSFKTSLPEAVAWPEGCPTCHAACTRKMTVEGTSMGGDMAAMISPVSMQRVTKLVVPCCDEHDDGGVWVTREGSESFIAFRSMAYYRAFEELNA